MKATVVGWVISLSPVDIVDSYTSGLYSVDSEDIVLFLFNVTIIFSLFELWFYVNYLSDTGIWKKYPSSDLQLG